MGHRLKIMGTPSVLSKVPIEFFCLDVFLHQFGNHFVFEIEFHFELVDLAGLKVVFRGQFTDRDLILEVTGERFLLFGME